MKTLGNIYLLLLVALFSACNDPYEDSTYQVYDMNPVSSYLETRSDEFSEWITVLKYADLFNAVNQASSYFTVLVPTNELKLFRMIIFPSLLMKVRRLEDLIQFM